MKHGKKYLDSAKLVERTRLYDPEEALELVQKMQRPISMKPSIVSSSGVDPAMLISRSEALLTAHERRTVVLVFAKGERPKPKKPALTL